MTVNATRDASAFASDSVRLIPSWLLVRSAGQGRNIDGHFQITDGLWHVADKLASALSAFAIVLDRRPGCDDGQQGAAAAIRHAQKGARLADRARDTLQRDLARIRREGSPHGYDPEARSSQLVRSTVQAAEALRRLNGELTEETRGTRRSADTAIAEVAGHLSEMSHALGEACQREARLADDAYTDAGMTRSSAPVSEALTGASAELRKAHAASGLAAEALRAAAAPAFGTRP